VGAALTGILTGVATVIEQALIATQPNTGPVTLQSLQDPLNALGFLAIGVGEALLLVAFALGLAEPPIPYESRATPSEAAAAGPTTEARVLPT
jgi:hypothetical protein